MSIFDVPDDFVRVSPVPMSMKDGNTPPSATFDVGMTYIGRVCLWTSMYMRLWRRTASARASGLTESRRSRLDLVDESDALETERRVGIAR